METTCCAILAGGKAERLPNKPFLLLNEKPLISFVIDATTGFFGNVAIVAKEEQEEKVKKIMRDKKQIKLILENSNKFSPWNGINTVVENIKADWVLLLACDMPFVCAELFDLLVSRISPGIDCVIPFSDRLQPLCALYRRSALEKAPLEGSITRFAESLKKDVIVIPKEKSFWLFNINAKEDFEKAEGMVKNNANNKDLKI